MSRDALDALYRRWLPGLWNAEPGAMAGLAREIFAADAVAHWGAGKDVHGPEGIAEQVRMATQLFDDLEVTLDVGPIVDGDLVAARWTFSGSYRGGIPGASATPGTRVAYPGTDVVRARDGVFVEYWPQGANDELMHQLGC
ncbi:MAG: ester cyclase [Streptosporangiales bacterium]